MLYLFVGERLVSDDFEGLELGKLNDLHSQMLPFPRKARDPAGG